MELDKKIIPCKLSGIERSETNILATLQQLDFKHESELVNKVIITLKGIIEKENQNIQIEEDSEENLRRGTLFYNFTDFNKALNLFNKSLTLNYNSAAALSNKSITLCKLNRFEEALESINEAIKINPKMVELWSNKGVILYHLNYFDDALHAYEKAIELDSSYSFAWTNRGVIFKKFYNIPEALENYIEAITLNPKNAVALSNIGVILDEIGFFEEAYEIQVKSTILNPYYPLAWYNIGVVLGKIGGSPEDILKAYDKATELNPKDADFWFNKGHALIKLNEYLKALDSFDKTTHINPNLIKAWNDKGSLLIKLSRPKEALLAFNTALKYETKIFLLVNKLIALKILGRKKEALEIIKKIEKITPKSSQDFYSLAFLFAFVNIKDKTIKYLVQAVKLDSQFKEKAKKDEIFKNLWDDKDFKKVVNN
ncbi:tetratricopeptide repeat protein [Methanobacterium paludis]|uniref:Tetratricopeptide TPR_1 repeat-containing protein n=1 Tax=Methanobacterium paludis (strain DSM 25820 / JCM 18151 / SWAN1) TaxID=868131 RepID=F6D3U3_METPW|nr:tetratricopeptide repeat protein [Methanobacterium paludis]AEG18745.1 Tetratricopeptide TPR_1 repeat-containing protein [Methanobacterium paludis]